MKSTKCRSLKIPVRIAQTRAWYTWSWNLYIFNGRALRGPLHKVPWSLLKTSVTTIFDYELNILFLISMGSILTKIGSFNLFYDCFAVFSSICNCQGTHNYLVFYGTITMGFDPFIFVLNCLLGVQNTRYILGFKDSGQRFVWKEIVGNERFSGDINHRNLSYV